MEENKSKAEEHSFSIITSVAKGQYVLKRVARTAWVAGST